MDDLEDGFEKLKISALTKYASLNKDLFRQVTIGPNRTVLDESIESTRDSSNVPDKHKSSEEADEKYTAERHQARSVRKPDKSRTRYVVLVEEDGLPIREIIKDLETDRLSSVSNAVRLRVDQFQKHSESLENDSKQERLLRQERVIRNMLDEEEKIMQVLNEDNATKRSERQKLLCHFQNLAAQRKKAAEELEARERKQKELSLLIENIKKVHAEFCKVSIEILNLHKTCQDLKLSADEEIKQSQLLFKMLEEIVSKCKLLKIDGSHVKKANEILNKLKSLKTQIEIKINKQNEIRAKAALQAQTVPSDTTDSKPVHVAPSSNDANLSKPVSSGEPEKRASSKLDKYISRENLKLYTEIMEKHSQSLKDLPNDQNLKQFKFDCKKAVNIPVNAISAVSSHHLRDKYDRLVNLLTGKPVRIAENQHFSAQNHPQGIAFCIDLLAKKMVLQGDLMISSNPEAAYPYATIIVSLWNEVPDFGQLLLGYFYMSCPYLVPFNVPKSVGQSDEEFYKSQGYQYADGQIEKQDKYLKRMTGIMRLYAAILITRPKSNHNAHPHGIEHGWRWLASILKLEPRVDITATMLHTFLEVAGYSMQMYYGKAFQKLLKIIIVKFMPIMKRNDSGGPVTRLEVLLQDYQEKGVFDKPEGMLPDNFW